MDDVKKPALIMFTAHWLVGMPFGIWLAFWQGMEAAGIWWGLSTGLIAAAVFLGLRGWRMTSRHRVPAPDEIPLF